ncbi:MAG TPA: PKD domain-containing protein, partial [Methanoregula sp.]|nr:PKD domain-containing protein [Methanoregula sp.]
MIEKKDQHRWGCKERLIRRGCILLILFGFVLIISLPVTAATTSIHIVRYANDGTTVLNETTKSYQWLQANLPILGDGTIHYYAQGPVFLDNPDPLVEEQLRWNPGENTNVQEKDQGAVKGTNLKNLCDLVGGMNEGEYLTLRASDGLTKSFAYTNVYEYASRQGPMVITWYRDGQYVDSGYADGMKLVFFADTSVNPWGIHVMGNYDWHESADPQYWYYYFDGNERYPTTTGLSIKYISDVFIYSDDSPPSLPVAAFSATPRSGTVPFTVTFTDTSTGTAPLSYAWDFQNDGSVDSTLKNPSYQYTAAGTYTVKLTVTNTAGSD